MIDPIHYARRWKGRRWHVIPHHNARVALCGVTLNPYDFWYGQTMEHPPPPPWPVCGACEQARTASGS